MKGIFNANPAKKSIFQNVRIEKNLGGIWYSLIPIALLSETGPVGKVIKYVA